MSIYYQDDQVTLYHGDCLELTAWQEADVLVTDAPYGMGFVSARTDTERPIAGDADATVRDAMLAAWGMKPAALFGTWRVPRPPLTKQVLIWNKHGSGPGLGDLTTAFGTSHEEIYLIGKWEKKRTPRRGSVITTESSPSALTVRTGHPTPKPVGLMEVLIEAAPSGIVADPFAGSGSTLIAARNLGRKVIGVELVERYCEIIAERLAQGALDFGSVI